MFKITHSIGFGEHSPMNHDLIERDLVNKARRHRPKAIFLVGAIPALIRGQRMYDPTLVDLEGP